MALKVATLASQMLAAALPILKKDAKEAQAFAKLEFTKIAQTIVAIGEQVDAGQINQEQAGLLLRDAEGRLPECPTHIEGPSSSGRRGCH